MAPRGALLLVWGAPNHELQEKSLVSMHCVSTRVCLLAHLIVHEIAQMGYQNCSFESEWIPPFQCPGIYRPFGACGFRTDHAVNVYSSADLVLWKFEGEALPFRSRPLGIYFRPKVVYNQQTHEYVLWVNLLHKTSVAQANALDLTQAYDGWLLR